MSETHPPTPVNPEKQARFEFELNILGMWLFLVTEIMLFGGLFAAYIVYRYLYPEGFMDASHHLDVVMGTVNTVILLTSSLTVALAVNSIQRGKQKGLIIFLMATIILGTAFLGIKGLEYLHKIEEGLFPGGIFVYPAPFTQQARLFFSLYFTMTGLHAVHMVLGILAMGVLLIMSVRNKFTSHRYDLIELTALYWHFVDIVWIFIFPLMYLIDRT
jgi:cytochrome c oxidase subunit III